jgi:predicted transposase/invertase (TIGR01784 family)
MLMDGKFNEGVEKGIEKGRAEGREEGRVEGREEGREESKIEIAKNMIQLGLTTEQTSKATGLTIEVIGELKRGSYA